MIALITAKDPTDQAVVALIHQLIEQEIRFNAWETQKLSAEIPENLDSFDAAVIGEEVLRKVSAADRAKLEKYASEKYVWILKDDCSSIDRTLLEQNMEVDINMFASVAGLKSEKLPPLSDKIIIDGFIEQAERFWSVKKVRVNEYSLHFLEGGLALLDTPYAPAGWEEKTEAAFQEICGLLNVDGNHDQLGAASLLNEYALRTGKSEIRQKMFDVVDKILEKRPRTPEGLLAMGGDKDDPLFFNGINTMWFGNNGYTTAGRHIVSNEMFHYYGGVFAACAAAGRPEMLDEAAAFLDHIDTVHRDKDNLLFHASRFKEVIGSKWGRGNTHALLGAFYMLRRYPDMPENILQKVIRFLDKSGHGLKAVQTENGLWRNVLDDPATSEETSCSVLITCIYSWCVNRGYMDKDFYAPMILKAREALKRKFWHGIGSGNCIGSFPAVNNPQFYRRRRHHGYVMPLIVPALLESAKLKK
jgi:hypothetical protein